jgi:hypothetical protein
MRDDLLTGNAFRGALVGGCYGAEPMSAATDFTWARRLCIGLSLFDLGLAGSVLATPAFFVSIFEPSLAGHPQDLLLRTGALWAVFMGVELWAALKGAQRPELFLVVGALRLLDVPADTVWLTAGHGFTWFGVLGLVFSPLFNLVSGLYLVRTWQRWGRAARP